ncbi:MBL fold metallo-hydrolase [Aureimonas sp. Leaf324]|uniref:MBL fold metallo-hydrolase n=1 Tax=Aureimonas sp. Leaf324 TaxID=1736336 RepID=UPI0006F2A3D1|nr:MBL fold metallo-hydrolase [Aureimonas sp. Leaf324]KQQ91179.1 MBL fold metallo-hydrolase [Aureimonas sp. Leaf324]
MSLDLNRHFDPQHGTPVPVEDAVVRITAPNSGPMTFHGTNSYLIGQECLIVVDPGPDDPAHFRALMAGIGGRPVDAILVTHTHLDHSALATRLAQETSAPLAAQGPHRTARPLLDGEINLLDAASDLAFTPDIVLHDNAETRFGETVIRGLHTPGHTGNHMAFALEGTGILFSGDHVMAWATSVVAPPDGSMSDYMRSLDRLLERSDRRYLPGHGGPVDNPAAFVRGLRAHRRMRESAVLEKVRAGLSTVPEMVAAIYHTTDRRLHGAAGLSVLAHLESLIERELVALDGPFGLTSRYCPA